MNINKNILLKFKKFIENDHFKNNSCIALAIIIFSSTSGFTNKNNYYTTADYKASQTILADLHLNNSLYEILNDTVQIMPEGNNSVEINDKNKSENENTDEMKIQFILERFNLTKEQFDTLVAIVLAESKWDSYEDAYSVINTIYNRTISKNWINYVNYLGKDGTGTNLYYQSICPNQFIVYQNGSYLSFLNNDNSDRQGYKAIIDFLTTGEKMHNFLSFVASDCGKEKYLQFVEKGNCYYNELTDDDMVTAENRIFDFDLEKQNITVFKNTGIEIIQEKTKVLK